MLEKVAETPINYDISLMLKECGFNEPCTFAHLSDGLGDTYSGYVNTIFKPKICSAPYPSQVIRWLRIVHEIHAEVTHNSNRYYSLVESEGLTHSELYESHPQAELAGIEQALLILQKRLDNGTATN